MRLTWKKRKPTEPGAYWVRGFGLPDHCGKALVEVEAHDGELWSNLHQCNSERYNDPFANWSALAATPPKLEWSKTLCDGESVDYDTAEKACAALGEGWRLPARMELESILDLTRHDPAIDTTRFPDTKSACYWTSTPCAWAPSCAWVVYFGNGYASGGNRNHRACVRAVRSVPAGQ